MKELNAFLEKHQIPRIFISNGFTRKSQSRLCDIINHPKTWFEQPKSIKKEFKAIHLWINDDRNNLNIIKNFYCNKNIKYRLRLTKEQRATLNDFFAKQKYPTHDDLLGLTKKTCIEYKMIYRWFATKRVQQKINKSTWFSRLTTTGGEQIDAEQFTNDVESDMRNDQILALNQVFENNPYPDIELVEKISDQLGRLEQVQQSHTVGPIGNRIFSLKYEFLSDEENFF
jgi:hypothetical protein